MGFSSDLKTPPYAWKNYEKVALRFFFIYFSIQILPIIGKLFTVNWLDFNFYDLFALTRFTPQFFSFNIG